MKYALYMPNFGTSSDPKLVADLAREAEEVGWDGFFLSDNILWTDPQNQPVGDPWVMLAAIALATSRVRLGTMITPLPRRRPWTVARQATTIDHLSNGRLILSVGIGGDWHGDFSAFGEPADDKTHGELLDEALAIIAGPRSRRMDWRLRERWGAAEDEGQGALAGGLDPKLSQSPKLGEEGSTAAPLPGFGVPPNLSIL